MHVPFQFGFPQIILIIIGLAGLWLFITAALELIRGHEIHQRKEKEEEERSRYGFVRRKFRRRIRAGRGLSGIVLIAVAISLLWLTFLVQTYLGLTGEIKVAQVRATKLANVPHQMSVELVLYDDNGNVASDNTYLMQGDEWMLQGDIVKFPTWANVIGLHTGYKLTRFEGRYDDINMERTAQHFAIELNGGDDGFFQAVNTHPTWYGWLAEASYGNAVFQGQGTFNIFATQDALTAQKTSG
ncbi:MAG TPA: hypothetical protein VFQ36_18150 [Ktedonobacteraceae bacterium]|nr:hypothetical protein [Ktedonobacteraceae bacterium]